MSRRPRLFTQEFLRFLLAGGTNTLITLGIYWLLLPFTGYTIAYTVSFACGLVSSYALNTFLVFRVGWSWLKLFAFPLVHLVNYVAGLAALTVLIRWLDVDAKLAPVLAIILVIPVNFLLTRVFMKHGQAQEQE